jgi:phospholipid/cholesterol/gamma-HCH transport system substrate-binding protein
MPSKNVEIKVGLFVIIGAAILLFGIWLAKGFRYQQDVYEFSVLFSEVGALASGDPVSVSGVNKGKVVSTELGMGGVIVTLALQRDVVLKTDATFTVKNIGLMGERYVAIHTGVADSLLDLNEIQNGGFDPGIPEVMGLMGDAIEKINTLIGLLQKTAVSPETLDKFTRAIHSLSDVSTRLQASMGKNLPRLEETIANFHGLSGDIREGINRNQPRLDSATVNFGKVSERLLALMDDLEVTSARIDEVATTLQESEGTLKLLIEDRALYDDLRRTANEIDQLVEDIRQNPKKYINFSVEIF